MEGNVGQPGVREREVMCYQRAGVNYYDAQKQLVVLWL